MATDTLDGPSIIADPETAQVLGAECLEKILEALPQECRERFRICLAPQPDWGGGIDAVPSRRKKVLCGQSAEDCERDSFRGKVKGLVWRE